MKCKPQTSVAQPWDARVNASVFEFGIEVAQNRCRRGLMLKPIDMDLDDVATQLHPPLDTVDKFSTDQFRRLLLISWPEVMTEVVQHVEGEETERQHSLDRVQIQGRETVYPEEGVLREEVFNAPPFGPSKGAVHALTPQLAAEFGKDNIRVNTVAPGIVRTPIHARNGIENVDDLAGLSLLDRVGEGEEAADVIFHLTQAKFTTGSVYPLDGGHTAGHHFG